MAKQGRLPEQFKLTSQQAQFYGAPGKRYVLRGPSRDTKALLAAMKAFREAAHG